MVFWDDIIKYKRILLNKGRLDPWQYIMDKIKLNERLYKGFLRRLKNNHLELCVNPKQLSDLEVLRFRKIYEDYNGKLVKAGIVSGY